MEPYFTKIPTIYYNNSLCRDISRRAKIVDDAARNSPYVFLPYEIKNSLRSDLIADYYYNDSQLDWLIYLSNRIVDPYYGWYLDQSSLNDLIIQKHGSLENSQKKIAFYRNNWANDDTEISVSQYNNTIALSWRKYFSPVWGNRSKIVSYKRKQFDATINTNRIIEYGSGNSSFTVGELVDIKETLNGSTLGVGEVVFSNSSILRIQSVSGNTTANTTHQKIIVGESSNSIVTVSTSNTILENITSEEEVFWSPVYLYEHENEKNEQKKVIDLIDSDRVYDIVSQFEERLSE